MIIELKKKVTRKELINEIRKKQSFLCIGLDTDPSKIPTFLKRKNDPIFEFNKSIIEATQHLCVAYKLNLAFYESLGEVGWQSLKKTLDYIPKNIFTIADAKRGDIGNTASMYAKTFFETYQFDSVTLSPYMGKDSITPFLDRKGKWAIVLGLTSNPGAEDFQMKELRSGEFIFEKVISTAKEWGNHENMMFVVGATKSEKLKRIREVAPKHFLLVPGIGAQGGSLEEVCENGLNQDVGLLINSSRGIIYASQAEDFAQAAANAAESIQSQMKAILEK